MNIYEKTEEFVISAFTSAGGKENIPHCVRTAYWAKHLKKDADEALLVAGVAHDIERAFKDGDIWKIPKEHEKGFLDEAYLEDHQRRSAKIIGEFLERQRCDEPFLTRVKELVARHEVGGTDDQNILKDADSISFFENNAERFVALVDVYGERKIIEKLDWMFERITSDEAREIAKPMYVLSRKKITHS